MKRRRRKPRYGISSKLILRMVPMQWDKALFVVTIVVLIGMGAVGVYAITR